MGALLVGVFIWTQVIIPGKSPINQFGINDRGQTVVTNDDGTTGIYDHGRFIPLPSPPASCACTITGVAVNNTGVVVGVALTAAGQEEAFTLSGGTYNFFSWAGWDNTEPRGIGNQGLVVGYAWSNDFSMSAGFVFDPSTGTFTNMTPGSAYPSIVQGVNRFGRIAGSFIQPTPRKTFGLISQYPPTSTVGAASVPFAAHIELNDVATRARGINDFGVTTGNVNATNGGTAGFVGNDLLGYELVVPPGGDAPDASSLCTGINNFGQLACTVWDLNSGQVRGLYIGTPALSR